MRGHHTLLLPNDPKSKGEIQKPLPCGLPQPQRDEVKRLQCKHLELKVGAQERTRAPATPVRECTRVSPNGALRGGGGMRFHRCTSVGNPDL